MLAPSIGILISSIKFRKWLWLLTLSFESRTRTDHDDFLSSGKVVCFGVGTRSKTPQYQVPLAMLLAGGSHGAGTMTVSLRKLHQTIRYRFVRLNYSESQLQSLVRWGNGRHSGLRLLISSYKLADCEFSCSLESGWSVYSIDSIMSDAPR